MASSSPSSDTEAERAAAGWLADARTVTVLTGAGISTDSGIPDFRGPQGVWKQDPAAQELSTLQAYVSDPDVRRRAWQGRLRHSAWAARPNAGHRALVDLERSGRLTAVVTQNIDGLHQAAGNSHDRVIEVHGTLHEVECLDCHARLPMRQVLDRVEAGEDDPPCETCGGMLKSATISFGQELDQDVWRRAFEVSAAGEVFLAVGSSLSVHPAAGLCDVAMGSSARLVVVNAEPTPYDRLADAVLHDPISDVLPRLVGDAPQTR
ncbi:MAG: NAD-dependent deacetylase [Streptosporangiales bacterium]|nr:NAD-dependent deacetylase [Streptosporangiales bacterium]